MKKIHIINAIQQVLIQELHLPNISAFTAQARLNEDLYIDSVLLMQLLISLELSLGINIPDSAFTQADFVTVNSLADFLFQQQETTENDNI